MKTTIQIATPSGRVVLAPLTPNTFQLVGSPKAIVFVTEIAPVLADEEIDINQASDALARIFYVGATTGETKPRMVSQKELQDRTLLENPIVLFQIRRELDESTDGVMMHEWVTDRVFLDDEEGRRWIEPQAHRYDPEEENKAWRLYGVAAQGALADVLRNARP